MLDRIDHWFGRRAATAGAAWPILLMTAVVAWPQAAPPPSLGVQSPAQQPVPAPLAPSQQAPPAQEENPGLINEIGKLWDKLPKIKSPSETLDDIKGASESLTSMTKPSTMVNGRMACVVGAGGTPDCKAGADRLCQSKGYKEGKSLDVDAAEKCSPKVFIPGRKREPGDCKTENYVIKALCQ
jgi:hypothetical protein